MMFGYYHLISIVYNLGIKSFRRFLGDSNEHQLLGTTDIGREIGKDENLWLMHRKIMMETIRVLVIA